MATPYIGLSKAPIGAAKVFTKQINTSGLVSGAAVVYDNSVAGGMVKAPTAALNQGFAGLIFTRYKVGDSTVVGQDVELQREGVGVGIHANGQSCNAGDQAVIAGTDGSLRPFVLGSDDDCEIVGTFDEKVGTVSANTPVLVNLNAGKVVHKDNS